MDKHPKLETLQILRYPDPKLRVETKRVKSPDSYFGELTERMSELLNEAKGVGLAATQVGLDCAFVVCMPSPDSGKIEGFLNPEIIEKSGRQVGEEGCLSVPGIWAKVRRAMHVKVRATRLNGEAVEFEAEGLAARMWQHEIDHLDGGLFVDRVGPASKILLRSKLHDLESAFERAQAERDRKK